ncbi:unnamed protein product [Moneuplotes crassus]|uniref:Uncharacterized protein n=1 Tax=Euplotes crassus TaxID=5936 RepID=A0AAD2D8V3_EUPCR|nr:unnamed protein product [Moneuplotes crassus]
MYKGANKPSYVLDKNLYCNLQPSFFNDDANMFLTCWNTKAEFDVSFAAKDLEIDYKPTKQSVLETCEALIEIGFIKKK